MENARPIAHVAEEWPNLVFLGLGLWWAWIWLCYNSVEVTALFPDELMAHYVRYMYLVSTLAIALSMATGAAFWKRLTPFLDKRWFVVAFGALACAATFLLGLSGAQNSVAVFVVCAFLTGVGTSVLCVKCGRIYGSVSLSESLIAGSIALLFAALLYFVGVGIPKEWRLAYVSVLPLLSALMLTMPVADPFPASVVGAHEVSSKHTPQRRLFWKLVIASSLVALSAGIGNGISSSLVSAGQYAWEGTVAVFFIGVIAAVLVWVCNHGDGSRRIGLVYTALMIMGIAIMLFTCLGFPIVYLAIGKNALWLIFICLISYTVFKFDFSSVRAFGIAQAFYFVSSAVGWAAGAAIAPWYGDVTVRTVVGIGMALVFVVVLVGVFTEADLRKIVDGSAAGEAETGAGEGVAVSVGPEAPAGEETAGAKAPVATDDLSRARDPKYGLSPRELEVLEPFAQGRSANWIADAFVISKNTVRSHLRNIYTKLGVHTRQQLLDFLAGKDPGDVQK